MSQLQCTKCNADFADLNDVQRASTLGVLDRIVVECRRCHHRQEFHGDEARRVDGLFRPSPAKTKNQTPAASPKAAAATKEKKE